MIDTDFTNTTDREFPVADEGVQTVEVTKVSEKVSSKNNDMVVFELKAKNGGKLWHNCMNYEGNRWMLKKTLHALTGKKPPKGKMSFDANHFVGKKLKVEIFHDSFNGRISPKVKDVIVPEEGDNESLEEMDGIDEF